MSDRDPTVVRSLAITAEDLVAALEARRQRDADVVLRATPPFSGRMRARLHVESAGRDAEDADAITVDPWDLLADDAPDYPRPSESEDALRGDPDVEYTIDRHRERHEQALEDWRSAVPEHVRESVAMETAGGEHRVDVKVLG